MFAEILTDILLGASLSVDAFAVTVGEALASPRDRLRNSLWNALYFGVFQALMPFLGFVLAGTVSERLMSLGPWISFFMLALVGGNMLRGAIRGEEETKENAEGGKFSHGRALLLAIATSIDALAVGVSFAFTLKVASILLPCAVIGLTTFAICALGGLLCAKLPKGSGKTAGIVGGCVLIGIGLKILIEGILE
ncbi:MAG: manganese efflux pump MntP family protein [Oscillospiraceae bacterium]|jgi:putative Mn2+ efflux pump MntP